MKNIEIPWAADRTRTYRVFEILPGFVSVMMFVAPVGLAFVSTELVSYFLISYVLIWVFKSIAMSRRVLQGYSRMKQTRVLDWVQMAHELSDPAQALKQYHKGINYLQQSHIRGLKLLLERGPLDLSADDIIHAVVIATYNEPPEIIHPTIEYVINSNGITTKNTVFFLAYEERAGEAKRAQSLAAIKKYGKNFLYAEAVGHALLDDEIPGKGANATYTGHKIKDWAEANGIDPARVLVTVLDADNRPDANYFACLTYIYLIAHDRKHKSYQPIALYVNNVWDVPAIMRLSAMANTYFHTANSMRLHALRNFSAHAQSLDALIETKFWSRRTIVEDGHQFWRAYFAFDGNHEVLPIYAPIYQDAVYAGTYRKTLIAQFKQIRRWTYGVSDVPYVASKLLMNKNISRRDGLAKFGRLLESHIGWATSAPLILLAGWIPLIVPTSTAETSYLAQQLPQIIARINTLALVILMLSLYIGIVTLPVRPKHHRRLRYLAFVWQWVFTPVVGIIFNSFAAINSQARLVTGRYLDRFDVTEKVVKQPKQS